MEILRYVAAFRKADDGALKYSYLDLITREKGQPFLANCKQRKPNFSELYDKKPFVIENINPKVESTWIGNGLYSWVLYQNVK